MKILSLFNHPLVVLLGFVYDARLWVTFHSNDMKNGQQTHHKSFIWAPFSNLSDVGFVLGTDGSSPSELGIESTVIE